MRANERRLEMYMRAARAWADSWPQTQEALSGLALKEAHEIMMARAQDNLPCNPEPS